MKTLLASALLLTLVIVACQTKQGSSGAASSLGSNPPQLFDKAMTICNPLNGGNSGNGGLGAESGLQGRLYYLTDDMPRFTTVEDYAKAINTGKTVFLTDVNVPTRMFTEGFPTASGDLLQIGGQTLVEWFSLILETHIQLTDSDPNGFYQMAMIADDGGTLEFSEDMINDNGVFTRFLDDDGTHSSRLACASKPLLMDQNSNIPARVKYYQGPRTEIALMLLWRRFDPESTPAPEPLCGAVGQNLFFEYHNNPSTPQPAYNDLLSRGWRPLKPGNFNLSGRQAGVNPCITNANWQ